MKKKYLIDEKIIFEYNKSQLIIDGKIIGIRHQCCELLYLLIKNHNFDDSYVSFKEIGDTLWPEYGFAADVKQNIKDCVKDLRSSLGNATYIKNIRKRGYRLCCDSLSLFDANTETQIEDYSNTPYPLDENFEQLLIKGSIAFKQYKGICVEIETLHQNITCLANKIFSEITAKQIHTKAYFDKFHELYFLAKALSEEKDNLNSLKSTFENLTKKYNICSLAEDISDSQCFYTIQVLDLLSEFAELSPKFNLLENKIANHERQFYSVLEKFRIEEYFIARIINFCLDNPRYGCSTQFDSLKENGLLDCYNNLYDRPMDKL